MKVTAKLKLSSLGVRTSGDKTYYYGSFLDEDDNKFIFILNDKLYNDLKLVKKHEDVDLKLNLFAPRDRSKARYCLGVVL